MIGGTILRFLYNLTSAGLSKGSNVSRYAMYKRICSYDAISDGEGDALAISDSGYLAAMVGFSQERIKEVSYPQVDILSLPYEDNTFRAVVSDQVLEHVAGDPRRAVMESLRVVREGGYILHTTCCMYPVHGAPQDYWRFTPEGLKILVGDMAEIIDAAGWGNPLASLFAAAGLRSAGIPHTPYHPAHLIATLNISTYPIMTWILAQKRGNLEQA